MDQGGTGGTGGTRLRCDGHKGVFLGLLGAPKWGLGVSPSLQEAPKSPPPCCHPAPRRGNGNFGLIPHGSHPRVPGFDSRPSPVIMWLPGKEGSRRNRLLCLAPLQEVFLLGGTKVRAGWEALRDGSPAHAPGRGARSRAGCP